MFCMWYKDLMRVSHFDVGTYTFELYKVVLACSADSAWAVYMYGW